GQLTRATHAPSGDHAGSTSSLALNVILRPLDPSTFITMMSSLVAPGSPTTTQANRVPSGDQSGSKKRPPVVTACWFDPPAFMTTMSEPYPRIRFETNAIRLPSGDQVGAMSCMEPGVRSCSLPPTEWTT